MTTEPKQSAQALTTLMPSLHGGTTLRQAIAKAIVLRASSAHPDELRIGVPELYNIGLGDTDLMDLSVIVADDMLVTYAGEYDETRA